VRRVGKTVIASSEYVRRALRDPECAIEMDRLGGMGVINAEGLLGRHVDVEAAIDQGGAAARDENGEFRYRANSAAFWGETRTATVAPAARI